MATPLFEPNNPGPPKNKYARFEPTTVNVQEQPKPKTGTQVASITSLFARPALPSEEALSAPQNCYVTHKSLVGRDAEFIKSVTVIDQSTDIAQATHVVNYGAQTQREIGELVTTVSDVTNKITALGTMETLSEVIGILRKLDPQKSKQESGFWNRKADTTVGDFVKEYNANESIVRKLLDNVRKCVSTTQAYLVQCEQLLEKHDSLMLLLEQYTVAGNMILERMRKSMFANTGALSLVDQFERRISDLNAFRQMMALAQQQTKLTQSNMVTQLLEAQSVIDAMIPIWRSSFSCLLATWQAKGVLATTPLSQVNDPEFEAAKTTTSTLIANLQGALHVKPVI